MRSGDNTDDIITKILESFLENYEREENILRNGSNYSFECVDLALVHFHNIKMKRGSWYIGSPERIKNKKATSNPKNLKDSNCFQYAIIAALHLHDIKNNPERITKRKPYISKYCWKDINVPAGSKEYKIFERNNKDIAFNILSVPFDKKEINITYKSDHNPLRKKQVILLMITDYDDNEQKNEWHYLAVKSI